MILFVVLSGSDDDKSESDGDTTVAQTTTSTAADSTTTTNTPEPQPKPEVPTITVKNGQPVGGLQELNFGEGEEMRFAVESNVEDEVHMHGYDVTEEVAPGRPAAFELEATIPGVFELELHHAVTQIAEITVD